MSESNNTLPVDYPYVGGRILNVRTGSSPVRTCKIRLIDLHVAGDCIVGGFYEMLEVDGCSADKLPEARPGILRLYDRRFSNYRNLPFHCRTPRWTPEREAALVAGIRSGEAGAYLNKLMQDDGLYKEAFKPKNVVEQEVYVHRVCQVAAMAFYNFNVSRPEFERMPQCEMLLEAPGILDPNGDITARRLRQDMSFFCVPGVLLIKCYDEPHEAFIDYTTKLDRLGMMDHWEWTMRADVWKSRWHFRRPNPIHSTIHATTLEMEKPIPGEEETDPPERRCPRGNSDS